MRRESRSETNTYALGEKNNSKGLGLGGAPVIAADGLLSFHFFFSVISLSVKLCSD